MLVFDNYPLGAAVLNIVAQHEQFIAKGLRALGLYPGQDMILLALQTGIHKQSELAQYLAVDHSTVAKSVARLLKAGIVTTEKDAKDKRVTLVKLTTRGVQLAAKVQTLCQEAEEISLQGLSQQEQNQFLQVSAKMLKNLKTANEAKK